MVGHAQSTSQAQCSRDSQADGHVLLVGHVDQCDHASTAQVHHEDDDQLVHVKDKNDGPEEQRVLLGFEQQGCHCCGVEWQVGEDEGNQERTVNAIGVQAKQNGLNADSTYAQQGPQSMLPCGHHKQPETVLAAYLDDGRECNAQRDEKTTKSHQEKKKS